LLGIAQLNVGVPLLILNEPSIAVEVPAELTIVPLKTGVPVIFKESLDVTDEANVPPLMLVIPAETGPLNVPPPILKLVEGTSVVRVPLQTIVPPTPPPNECIVTVPSYVPSLMPPYL
jgi:hypothetical protein